jgi:hypothetical protein
MEAKTMKLLKVSSWRLYNKVHKYLGNYLGITNMDNNASKFLMKRKLGKSEI